MDRWTFEQILQERGKHFLSPINFVPDTDHPGSMVAQSAIVSPSGFHADVYLRYNEKTLRSTINIIVSGVGVVCRIDVNGSKHDKAGKTHKHSLRTARCPSRNLPHADPRPDLEGADMETMIAVLCDEARIDPPRSSH